MHPKIVTAAATLTLIGAAANAAPSAWNVGPDSEIAELITSGDCRMVIIGDSISTKQANTQFQSSMYWGVIRTWDPHRWAGICAPSNGQYPTMQLWIPPGWAADVSIHGGGSYPATYGYARFSPATYIDAIFEHADVPSDTSLYGIQLNLNTQWRNGPWFTSDEVTATFVLFRTPQTIPSLIAQGFRGGVGSINSDPFDITGPAQVVGVPAPTIPPGNREARFRIHSWGEHDESIQPDHLIALTTRVYLPDVEGFQLDAIAIGGSRLRNHLSDGHYADEHLREYLRHTGNPNLIYIQIGANDGNYTQRWHDDMIALIDRYDRISADNGVQPRFLLVPPYGTQNSIEQEAALEMASGLFSIAFTGTGRVNPDRIGFVNLPRLIGGPIDPSLLLDNIHPRPSGANFLAQTVWDTVTQGACDADISGSADPASPDFMVPDGVVDAEDFFTFLRLFADADPRADITGSASPTSPEFLVPDGVIDAEDFFAFLFLFAAGC